MTKYAQIPVSRLDYMLRELNKSKTPPSFVIKSPPGRGVLYTIRSVYPDDEVCTVNFIDDVSMSETLVKEALQQNSGAMFILELDIDNATGDATISPGLTQAMLGHLNSGGRLIILSQGNVQISSPELINRILPTALVD